MCGVRVAARLFLLFISCLFGANALETQDHRIPIHENNSTKIVFTQEEKDYLKNLKEIRVCDFADWMPYAGHDKEHTFGIIVDYYKAFGSSIGVPVRFVRGSGTEGCAQMVKKGEADVVSSIGLPNTFGYIVPSDEIGSDFAALVTKLDTPFVNDINSLKEKAVGVIGHYKNMIKYLHKAYPHLHLQETDSTQDGLKKVARGELYAFIDIYRVAAYNIRREYIGELKINTKVYPLVLRGHVGIAANNKVLLGIFNKAIASLSPEERQLIMNRWMSAKELVKFDYTLTWEIALLALLFIAVMLYYHLRERYQQKKLLAHQAKLAGMGTMINNIAHQWRQPLNRINSNIAVIDTVVQSDNIDIAMIKAKLDNIKNSTRYMSDTIEDFSNYFNPHKEKTRFALCETVQKALKLLESRTKDIDIEIVSDQEVWVNTYEKEYQQVILVLLNNALDQFKSKETNDPKIRIGIKKQNQKTILSICDNGGGIEAKNIDHIFEPYFTTKFADEGTGLGLYMAKVLIESGIGGTLIAQNSDTGACFEIEIEGDDNA